MLYFKAILIGILTEISLALIRSQVDLHRRSTHHTCYSNDECNKRLRGFWSAYEFVCCTTIVCDENYGNYYLVHSGCSARIHCGSVVQIKDYTRFAARMEKQFYDMFNPELEGDCSNTRGKLTSGMPDATLVTDNLPAKVPTLPPLREAPPTLCPCADRSECCIQIVCSDILQNGAKYYNFGIECVPQCTSFVTKIRSLYTFYIPIDIWEKRNVYERDEAAPPVEESCRETRYFYHWTTVNGS